jgi:hypothetical protein
MAEPTLDQRTPICHLKYEADDTRNYNWSKIDDVVGRAFTPGSPLQLPSPLTIGDLHVQGLDVEGWLVVPNGPVTFPAGALAVSTIATRTQAHTVLSGTHTYNPGPSPWQEILALPPITTRGGPIMLVAALGGQIQFTAQPTGTTAYVGLGWAVATLSPPDVWVQTPQVTLCGNTGGTAVTVPMPPLIAFDQRAPQTVTYHLMVSTSSTAVSLLSNGGAAWGYELV